jgi:ribonuclease HI
MNRLKTQIVKTSGWNVRLVLTPAIVGELMWWHTQLKRNIPTLMRIEGETATMYTDASPQGWGGWLEMGQGNDQQQWVVQGVWSQSMIHTSNYLEMLAVYLCLRHFLKIGKLEFVKVIHLRTDNTSVMFDVNRRRAASTLLRPLKLILSFTEREHLQIMASHIPGVDNVIADKLSRLARSGDYQIRTETLENGLRQLGTTVQVDLFATRDNRKSRDFVSINNDPLARGRNAFSMAWRGFLPLIHPPIPLILRCLRKVAEEKVRGVMIVPHWQGQPWNQMLRAMTVKAVILGKAKEILIPGRYMTNSGQQLPPGMMIICLVDGGMKRDG